MSAEQYEHSLPGEALELLDSLIQMFYKRIVELEEDGKLIIKPGDFMKMIELRHKLSPTANEVQNFWKKIAQIRKGSVKKHSHKEKLSKEKDK